MIAYSCARLYTPHESLQNAAVLVDDGAVIEFFSRASKPLPAAAKHIALEECVITPGFIDIHIHGSVGYDVMQDDATARAHFEKFLAQHGVTSYYPTTVTASLDATLKALERIGVDIDCENENGAEPLGIHLEGPFISRTCRGVHPPEHLLQPSISIFEKMWNAAGGHVRLITIAPELDGALELIQAATQRNVCVSLGHSDASLAAAQAGVAAGGRHATHTFNAMRPLSHRDPGILGEVLTNNAVTADVIADGIHVDPVVVDLLAKAKGPENLVLITDAMSAAGMPDGHYKLGAFDVELKDGKCTVDGKLAGSALTLDRAVRNVMSFANLNLQRAVSAASANPARVMGIQRKGTIAPGADADFVVLTPNGDVRATVIRGELVQ